MTTMKQKTVIACVASLLAGATVSTAQEKDAIRNTPGLEVLQVDIHDRLYPDRWPAPVEPVTISIPRGAPVTFQFAVRADKGREAKLGVKCDAPGEARIHWLEPVHVEGNTQGSKINRPGGKVPDGWMNYLVRKAPFDTLEVLVEADTMPIAASCTHGVVVEFTPPADTKAGTYKGELRVSAGGKKASVPFAFRVHQTALPDPLPIRSIHWLWPEPENLTNGEVPEWWSERHWTLLKAAGKQLRRFGDTTVYTPIVNYRDPLIQIVRRKDGTYAFDYSRFDRWVETFLALGFTEFKGHPVGGGHKINVPPMAHGFGGVWVRDEADGKIKPLLDNPKDAEPWLAFLTIFYESFHAHLTAKGWVGIYTQSQLDEPSSVQVYERLSGLARKHMPGVRTMDAIHVRADRFSPLVDEQVFNLIGLNRYHKVAAQRKAKGQGVWLYHCTSPYPPHPNRHIDNHLAESRLYPWMCYKLGANGFLYWGANIYRGADEYKTSLGPFPAPKNHQNPGHPPGDNWFYYRSPQGLRPSIRIVSHREGLIDNALLTALAAHDPALAKQLVNKIAASISRFERRPAIYHDARTAMLEALDQ